MGSNLAQCNLKLTSMSAGLMMAIIKTPKHVAIYFLIFNPCVKRPDDGVHKEHRTTNNTEYTTQKIVHYRYVNRVSSSFKLNKHGTNSTTPVSLNVQ
jgi:hypothetical protein